MQVNSVVIGLSKRPAVRDDARNALAQSGEHTGHNTELRAPVLVIDFERAGREAGRQPTIKVASRLLNSK
jgi:hypothetical protein